jgi:hypothetical protein
MEILTPKENTYRTAVPRRSRRETLSAASPNLVRDAVDEARVAHLDDGLDLAQSSGTESRRSLRVALIGVWAAAESIISDLGTLRVSDNDKLGVRAAGVETVDG